MKIDGEPYCESKGISWFHDCVMTHAVWHNSYGSYEPETGLRVVKDGEPVKESFRLYHHYTSDFELAERLILRSFRKGWDADRASRLIEWCGKRKRAKAKIL